MEIVEYHCCSDCRYSFSIPAADNTFVWEIGCTKKNKNVNSSGGLSRCDEFEEKNEM